MSQFEELLAQLKSAEDEQENLAKSLPAGGEESEDATDIVEEETGDEINEEEDGDDDDESSLTKSIKVGDEEFEVIDAEVMIKSLDGLTARVGEQEEVMAKGLTSALKLIQQQGEMLKSLHAQVATLGNQGAGRKAAMTLHEKATAIAAPGGSSNAVPTRDEIMAKSEAAWSAGKITGNEFTEIDVALRQGAVPNAALLAKALN